MEYRSFQEVLNYAIAREQGANSPYRLLAGQDELDSVVPKDY